jgi:hypothetical protein
MIVVTLHEPSKKISEADKDVEYITIRPEGVAIYYTDKMMRMIPWWRVWNVQETDS